MVTVRESPRVPLQAGVYPERGTRDSMMLDMIQHAAQSGAELALKRMREERKHGRQDQGTGSLELGKILLGARHRQGVTQHQLASQAGIHSTTVGKIETGERGMSLQTFCRLALHLDPSFTRDVIIEVSSWP